MLGLVGRKEGTRQLYQAGEAVQVTFITVLPNHITQIKTIKRDGYRAVQLTSGQKAVRKVNKTEVGHYNKAGVETGLGLWEFRLDGEVDGIEKTWRPGHTLTLETFAETKWVDVTAITKGKGFAGVIKRHHFASQDATHGNSLSHRAPGSIGQRQAPRRVFKGKKMPGQLGNKFRTLKSLAVLAIYPEHHLLMLKGSIPGAPGSIVRVKRAVGLRYRHEHGA
jgi:large subunit ribosomal protein L3